LLSVDPVYRAGLEALGAANATLGALVLIRSLIEGLAMLYYVMGDDAMADAGPRAVRLEQSWARSNLELVRAAAPAMDDQRAVVEERVAEIDEIDKAIRWKGAVRAYNATNTVTKLAADQTSIGCRDSGAPRLRWFIWVRGTGT
jgi:hypothetical protein